jgi:YD repeat-containing protein
LLGGSYRGQEVLELQYQGLKPIVQTYQELNCQQFDGKGNLISLIDSLNAITHGYTYDSLDRLLTAEGTGTNPLQNTGGTAQEAQGQIFTGCCSKAQFKLADF